MNSVKLASLVSFAALALAACGGDAPDPKMPANSPVPRSDAPATPDSRAADLANPGTTNTPTSDSTTGNGMAGAGGMAGMGSAGATAVPAAPPAVPATEPLSDPEIAAITRTVNAGEVEEGKFAMGKAKDPKVKKFADMMVKHHTQANDDAQKLAAKMKLTPQENAMTRELQSKAKQGLVELRAKSGADFDRAYVDAQIKEHQDVLETIDAKLMPNAKSTELKTFLQQLRPKIQMHLDEAKQLQSQLK